jgi:hypothetical protein
VLAAYVVDNSRGKVQNVVTDSSALTASEWVLYMT